MTDITEIFNQHLDGIFDVRNDPIFKSLISRSESVPETEIINPADLNMGALASMLEWIRRLMLFMVDQIYMTRAGDVWLDLMMHQHIGLVRYAGESDTAYVDRVQQFIISPKVSPAAIIYHFRRFSPDAEPRIIEGIQDAMFSDLSFSDIDIGFRVETPGDEFNHYVFPAITTSRAASSFFFILELTGTPDGVIPEIFEWLSRWKSAGIAAEVRIYR